MWYRVLVAALACAGTTLNVSDRRSYSFRLPPDRTLSVEITNGDLRVTGEERADAAVGIVRQAPTTATLVPIRVDESEGHVSILATQADGHSDPARRTDVTLRVPHGATLTALRVMEGRLTLMALHGAVTADVRRGSIKASHVAGTVRLETGIGDVTADHMRLTPHGLLRLRAFNGDVRLSLAARPADARVMALALNGEIHSSLPLTMRDTWGPRWGETTLGRGAPVISLDVITGRIEIDVP